MPALPRQVSTMDRAAKGIYIGAPACFALEEAIRPVCEAFGAYESTGGCYVVGSSLERADWRDVDVRLMLDDAQFAALFPCAGQHWENDTRWLVLTVAISERLTKLTGLPIDFQFQPQTLANARHKGRRNAIGVRIPQEADRLPAPPPETAIRDGRSIAWASTRRRSMPSWS